MSNAPVQPSSGPASYPASVPWALSALVALVALVALAATALALPGTGAQVHTDPVDAGPGAADVVRIGAGSDGSNLYVWVQVNTPVSQPKPTTADFGSLSWEYQLGLNYGTGAWCPFLNAESTAAGTFVYPAAGATRARATPCSSGVSASYTNPLTAAWRCNELEFKVPFSSLRTPLPGNPAVGPGTTLVFQHSPDDGASGAVAYQFTRAIGAGGYTDGMWGAGSFTIGDPFLMYQPPPTGLTATMVGDNDIQLTWTLPTPNDSQPIQYFNIYRDGVLIGSTATATATSFTDNDLPRQLETTTIPTYKYEVASVNCDQLPNNGEGTRTSVTITPDFRPDAPTALSVTGFDHDSVDLSWTAPSDKPTTGASGVQGYRVYRSTSGTVTSSDTLVCTIGSAAVTTCTDSTPDPDTFYRYAVQAVDGYAPLENRGLFSTTVTVTTKPLPKPTADFSWLPASPCQNQAVMFTDASSASLVDDSEWDFDDGTTITFDPWVTSVTHTFTSPDTYTVQLTVNNDAYGTNDTESQAITVQDCKPTADFSWTPAMPCQNEDVTFTDGSTPTGNIDRSTWTIAGTVVSLDPWGADPGDRSFASPGAKSVQLTVHNDTSGTSDTVTKTLSVQDCGVTAALSWAPAVPCQNEPVTFTDGSTPVANLDKSAWDLGDTTLVTLDPWASAPAPHAYTSAGTYTVKVTVHNVTSGLSDSEAKTLTVQDCSASADFSWTPAVPCQNESVTFTDLSSPAAYLVRAEWDFAGAKVPVDPWAAGTVGRVYGAPGDYTVSLTAEDSAGGTDTATKTVTVQDCSVAAAFTWTPAAPCAGQKVTFTDTSTPAANIDKSAWDFGDGGGIGLDPWALSTKHIFPGAGTYAVELTVENSTSGLTDSVQQDLAAADCGSWVAFSWDGIVCVGEPVVFTDDSGPQASITGVAWDFGDGTTFTGAWSPTRTHTFSAAGTYTVDLSVSFGSEERSLEETVQVLGCQDPVPVFTWQAKGLTLDLFDASYDPDGTVVAYLWEFGDGTESTSMDPQHVFDDYGQYLVTLTVTDDEGRSASRSEVVTLSPPSGPAPASAAASTDAPAVEPEAGNKPPVAHAGDDIAVVAAPGASAALDGSRSTDPDGDVLGYAWLQTAGPAVVLDDAEAVRPSFVLPAGAAGTTIVFRLEVSDGVASDQDDVLITVEAPAPPSVDFALDVVAPGAVALEADGPPGTEYAWSFGDGATGSGPRVEHRFEPGLYTVRLTATSPNGASSSVQKSLNVPGPAAPAEVPVAEERPDLQQVTKAPTATPEAVASAPREAVITIFAAAVVAAAALVAVVVRLVRRP